VTGVQTCALPILAERGETLETLGDAWESVARKLCGR